MFLQNPRVPSNNTQTVGQHRGSQALLGANVTGVSRRAPGCDLTPQDQHMAQSGLFLPEESS